VDIFDSPERGRARLPSLDINLKGVVGISWVDSRDDSNGKQDDVYFTASLDGGETFQKPARISTVSSNPRTDLNGDVSNKFNGGGHYLGLTARPDGSFQLVWSDSRSGVYQLQTSNVHVKSE
jgi:hypothetical protein